MVVPHPLLAVLLVDDEVQYLELRAAVMKTYGFSVITTSDPMEAMAMVAKRKEALDVAVLDYDMPVMNGCVLANRLRAMWPELKIILYSGAVDIPENEMTSIDVFVSKSDGMDALLRQISRLGQVSSGLPERFVLSKALAAGSALDLVDGLNT